MAGAAIGELLFGRMGGVVGAVTGSRVTRQTVSSVQVHITVDNLKQPLNVIEFLKRPTRRDFPRCQDALRSANQWIGALHVAMHRAAQSSAITSSK